MPTMIIHAVLLRYSGCQFSPITMHTTMAATPMTVDTPSPALRRYTRNPNAIAIMMNRIEIMAVVAFAALAAISTTPLSV